MKEAGFLKFSQMLAAMPDVCTLHTVIVSNSLTAPHLRVAGTSDKLWLLISVSD